MSVWHGCKVDECVSLSLTHTLAVLRLHLFGFTCDPLGTSELSVQHGAPHITLSTPLLKLASKSSHSELNNTEQAECLRHKRNTDESTAGLETVAEVKEW